MTTHEVEDYQTLAVAVVTQAIRDLDRPQLATWLASPDAAVWRGWLPDLNTAAVVDRLRRAA